MEMKVGLGGSVPACEFVCYHQSAILQDPSACVSYSTREAIVAVVGALYHAGITIFHHQSDRTGPPGNTEPQPYFGRIRVVDHHRVVS
jgi:hypothetical protein